jgi:hypothetical protein
MATITAVLLIGSTFGSLFPPDAAAAKRKRGPVVQPDLRILAVTASPDPYTPGRGVLEFKVEIELPKDLNDGAILEVSSLISSPSMSSMRFLSVRQPMALQPVESTPVTESADPPKGRVRIMLTWDGMDQSKQLVEHGRYQYEIRAKLLAAGDNGPRTHMSAWPKRGAIAVR